MGETFVADANLGSRRQENVIESSQKEICFPDAILFPKQMFSGLATLEETMFPQQFPNLARSLKRVTRSGQFCF